MGGVVPESELQRQPGKRMSFAVGSQSWKQRIEKRCGGWLTCFGSLPCLPLPISHHRSKGMQSEGEWVNGFRKQCFPHRPCLVCRTPGISEPCSELQLRLHG